MATTKDSASCAPTPTTRERRGLDLARERAGEIWSVGAGLWRVPSSDGETVYIADLRRESCSCEDHRRSGKTCKHLYAAGVVRAKTAPCAGCSRRFAHRDLIEITEDHGSLTFFAGDVVCSECAHSHGVL